MSPGVQYRRYQLRPGTIDEFASVWRDQLIPLRRTFGFRVVGAWLLRETDEFVWIVAHDQDFEAANAAYYQSPGRSAVTPAPKTFIEKSTSEMLETFYP